MSTVKQVITGAKSEKSITAKKNLEGFVTQIDDRLKKYFDSELNSPFGISTKEKKLSKEIWKHIKEHNLRPAKRLRASFVFYAYKMLGGKKYDAALNAAMSIELIHTALLMHDDFMDQDNTRRGLPTTHIYYSNIHKNNKYRFDPHHFGEAMAVNTGDIALLAGHQILLDSPFSSQRKLKATKKLLRGIVNTGLGQAYDVTLESIGKATEEDIINLHHAKTGIYTYENPLHIGALLAGAKDKDLELLSLYARPGGIAFQLQDDILGLFGTPEKTGKPAHSDLRQGKMTLLIVKAFEKADKKQSKQLSLLWGKHDLTENEAQEARKIVIDTGSLEYSHEISVQYAKKAQEAIPKMKRRGWDKDAIDYLDGIAQYMVERQV